MQPDPRKPDELDAVTPAEGDWEVLGGDEFPSLEEPLNSPGVAATISLEPARKEPLAAAAAPLGVPEERKTSAPRWLWSAVIAGGCTLLLCGTGLGIGVMWLLSPPAPTVASGPSAAAPAPPGPPAAPPPLVQPLSANPASAAPGTTLPSEPTPKPTPVPMATVAPASLELPTTAPAEPAIEATSALPTESKPAEAPAVTVTEPPQTTAPAEPAAPTDDPPTEAAEPLIASAAPPPPPAIESTEQRAAYIAHVKSMLEVGLGKGQNREKAGQHFEQALAICESDPRLYYGYALVLRNTKPADAASLLRKSMQAGAHPYPPAWRLLIDFELKKPLEARVVGGLANFARRVEESSAPWPDEAGKAEFAAYLGRVVGFWQGPSSDSKKFEQAVREADAAMLAALSGSRKQAYELGKAEVLSIYDLTQQQASVQSEQQVQQAQKEQSKAERVLQAKQQELNDDEQKLVRTKEDYDQKWETLKAEFERDGATLENELKVVVSQGATIENNLARTERTIEYWQSRAAGAFAIRMQQSQGKSNNPSPVEIEAQGKVTALTIERGFLRAQLNEYVRRAQTLQLQGQMLIAKMVRAENEYQRATNQIVKEGAGIAELRKKFAGQADRLASKSAPQQKRAGSPAELRRLSTYAPINAAEESQRIIASYAGQ
jgi:hypothetical protein